MRKTNEPTNNTLVDLSEIEIDTSEPSEKRVAQFLEKVGNPCVFKVGEITIKVKSNSDRSLLDALVSAYTQEDVYDY